MSFFFTCPHCRDMCQVRHRELNCRIFRHANFKSRRGFVNPHAPREECERWVRQGLIFGCGKPFRFVGPADGNSPENRVEACGYI